MVFHGVIPPDCLPPPLVSAGCPPIIGRPSCFPSNDQLSACSMRPLANGYGLDPTCGQLTWSEVRCSAKRVQRVPSSGFEKEFQSLACWPSGRHAQTRGTPAAGERSRLGRAFSPHSKRRSFRPALREKTPTRSRLAFRVSKRRAQTGSILFVQSSTFDLDSQ